MDSENKHRIAEVDIVLNPDPEWLQPTLTGNPAEIGMGDVDPNLMNLARLRPNWFDVQSVVTHELGHAIGLLDIGHRETPWWGTGTDAHKAQQTMYGWYYPGTTNKRTLGDGDVAGLWRIWLDDLGLPRHHQQ